ncbi:MAG: hypothetical protein ACN4G0_10790, partial [Polyangiales bacterium]
DLLAGFWLVALLFSLNELHENPRPGRSQLLVVGALAFLGASSKLPFAIAAVAAWLAWSIRTRAPESRRAGSAITAGIAVHLVLRAIFAPFQGQLGASENVFADPQIWFALPKIVGKGAAALLSFRAEAMQSLSWALFGTWSPADWLGLLVVVLVFAVLLYRKDWPGLVYWLGAWLTLAPVLIVSGAFWMGFDRYLYIPSILAVLALSPYVARAASHGRNVRVAMVAASLVLILLAAFQSRKASTAYAGQDSYDRALLRDHADDPSIHYYFARVASRSGDDEALREHLSSMPAPPWPRPIIVQTYDLAKRANDDAKSREAIDALVATADGASRCAAVRAQLEAWLEDSEDPAAAEPLEQALQRVKCGP